MIIIIVAVSENNVLGKDNKLLWHLPNDFKRFKELTTGHHIIMGRKTFESLPKLLPNRTHVIITRQDNFRAENCIVVKSLEEAIKSCPAEEDSFIIGGGEIYLQGIPFADKLEITKVHANFEGDTYFPEIDTNIWQVVKTENHTKDEKHLYDYTYITLVKQLANQLAISNSCTQ